MSAQDDVLAAFGEPRKRVVEPEEPVEQTEPEETAVEAGELATDGDQDGQLAAEGDSLPEGDAEAAGRSAPGTADASADDESSADGGASADGESSANGDASTDGDAAAADTAAPEAAAEPPAADASAEPSALDAAPAIHEQALTTEQTTSTPAPAEPPQLYLDPSAFFTQLQAESAPKPQRRWPRLLLRYTSALALAGAVGAGTAYAVTLPKRTDIPTLATPSDGRYDFPVIARIAPPVGKPGPGEESNGGQVHYADLRQYLLPVPKGAVLKEDGWEPAKDFVSGVEGASLAGQLNDAGLRRIAWRGWTSEDGQHMVVELLQFPDHAAAYALEGALASAVPNKAGKAESVVPKYTVPVPGDTTEDLAVRRFDTVEGLAGQIERRAVFRSGDVVVVVTSTAPQNTSDVSIDQVLLLQAEMLQ